MNEKKDCKIIQDLLPNYIEGLTNEETNKYIEEHLKGCTECKKMLENMQTDLESNIADEDKKTVKYFKKYRNKLRFLWIILLLILVIFVGDIARKMIILSNLSNRSKEYINSDNYHYLAYNYFKDEIVISEIWNLGEKRKVLLTCITQEGTTKSLIYGNKTGIDEWGNEVYDVNTYKVNGNSKTAELNENRAIGGIPQSLINALAEDFQNLFLVAIHSSVKNTIYSGEECYYIQSSKYLCNMYVSKNTGLTVNTLTQEAENSNGLIEKMPLKDAIYEFNTVTENDFIEPDISEYEIKQ